MPGGVGSNPDGVPTKYGTEILRARAVALTRDMVVVVGPTGVIGQISGATKRCGPRLGRGCSAGGIGIATEPNSEWSFIYPVGRRRWAKIVAMPGGVGSNPDGVPTRKGTEILRACAVALTRDKVVFKPFFGAGGKKWGCGSPGAGCPRSPIPPGGVLGPKFPGDRRSPLHILDQPL